MGQLRPVYTITHERGGECKELYIPALFASAMSTTQIRGVRSYMQDYVPESGV